MSDLYQQLILEAAENPQNVGQLTNANFLGAESNASCGDDIQVWLTVDESTGVISDVAWQGQGCIISQAAMSELSERIKGQTKQQIVEHTQQDMLKLLGLEQISTGRINCLMLGLKAIKSALSK